MLVCGFDVGLCNAALCVLDTARSTDSIVYCTRINFLRPKQFAEELRFEFERLGFYVRLFLEDHRGILAGVGLFVVERQIGRQTSCIMAALQAGLLELAPTMVVHPSKIKQEFGIGRGDHAANKEAAVRYVHSHSTADDLQTLQWAAADGKEDDLCDAVLLARYAKRHRKELLASFTKPAVVTSRQKAVRRTKMANGGYARTLDNDRSDKPRGAPPPHGGFIKRKRTDGGFV